MKELIKHLDELFNKWKAEILAFESQNKGVSLIGIKQPIIVNIPEKWMWEPVMKRIKEVFPIAQWKYNHTPEGEDNWDRFAFKTCIIVECGGLIGYDPINYYAEIFPDAPILNVFIFMEQYKPTEKYK